jgi:hypothetical protein
MAPSPVVVIDCPPFAGVENALRAADERVLQKFLVEVRLRVKGLARLKSFV